MSQAKQGRQTLAHNELRLFWHNFASSLLSLSSYHAERCEIIKKYAIHYCVRFRKPPSSALQNSKKPSQACTSVVRRVSSGTKDLLMLESISEADSSDINATRDGDEVS